ncbi:MAG: FAD-dependent oxidoreductase, partial [Phycisphaerales bacterium]|nr:FAD-dependent oxidoreductase [Phycisphaerales bacterium]
MAYFPLVPGSHAPDWSSDSSAFGTVGVDTVATDQHAFIHRARVRVVTPRSVAEVVAAVNQARETGTSLAVSGGRHAMGGQAWADRRVMLDMRQLDRVRWVDVQAGLVYAEAGVQWPALLAEIDRLQAEAGALGRWSIAQKQTGADDLTLGGAVAANIHGRGLSMTPLVGDIHALTVVTPDGVVRQIDRQHEPDLFALVIGGYGLFGVVVEVVLRLVPRQTLRRIVRVIDIHDAIGAAERRISEGSIYG